LLLICEVLVDRLGTDMQVFFSATMIAFAALFVASAAMIKQKANADRRLPEGTPEEIKAVTAKLAPRNLCWCQNNHRRFRIQKFLKGGVSIGTFTLSFPPQRGAGGVWGTVAISSGRR
jgi:hypothetical protein